MKLVGIDVGKYSVKVVEIESAFRRFEIREYHERKTHGHDPYQVVSEIIFGMPKPADKVAVAIDPSHETIRVLDIPSRDKKAVEAAVAFELEDELPFGVEDGVHSYSIAAQSGSISRVHVAATLKKYVSEVIGKFEEVGISPDIITTESWALSQILRRFEGGQSLEGEPRPVMLVQIGKERTTITVEQEGVPLISKEILFGGDDITRTIADRYSMSFDEAEKAKLDSGFVLSSAHKEKASDDQVAYSETIYGALKTLITEIRQANLACRTTNEHRPHTIYLSGLSAVLPGLRSLIEDEIHIQTEYVYPFRLLSESSIDYARETENSFMLATALAYSLTSSERARTPNLRKGEFSKERATGEIRLENWMGLLKGGGIVAACLIFSLVVQSFFYESKIDSINDKLRRSLKSFYPAAGPSSIRTKMAAPSKTLKEVESQLKGGDKMDELFKGSSKSHLAFLKNLSSKVPKSLVTDMVSFQVGSSVSEPYGAKKPVKAEMSFLFSDKTSVERMKGILEKLMDKVAASKPAEVKSKSGQIKYRVNYSGSPKESAYGR